MGHAGAAPWLLIGTAPGTDDLLYTGEMAATEYLYPTLPLGQTLYGRIWTLTDGLWLHSDIRFQVGARPLAALVYPTDGPQTWI